LDRKKDLENEDPISITFVASAEVMIELLRRAFEPEIAEAMDFRGKRLRSLAALASTVPVCRLTYPSGLARLPEVGTAIFRDAAGQND